MSQNPKILIVDDNQINRQYFSMSLKRTYVHVDVAENGIDAINKARKTDYDLILMDIRMPEMDGYETTKKIQSLANQVDTVIIATSAESINNSQRHLFDDFLSKPIRPKQLAEAVKYHTHNNANDTEIFNKHNALKFAYDDKEIMNKLIGMFILELPEQIKLLTELLYHKDYTSCLQLLHKLRGSCQTCGADNLNEKVIELSHEINSDGRHKDVLEKHLKEVNVASAAYISFFSN